jgi:hypothetical protein
MAGTSPAMTSQENAGSDPWGRQAQAGYKPTWDTYAYNSTMAAE